MRKLTNEEFLQKLKAIHGDEYIPLEDYKGARTKICVLHNKCGKSYMTTPDNNLYNGGCESCGYDKMKKAQRKTDKQFNKEVFELVGDEYTFLDKYINNTTKLLVKHNKCGNEYYVTPRDFLSGRRCPKERNLRISKSVTKDHEYFMQRLGQSLSVDYELLSKYENARTKLKVLHKKCGKIFFISPMHLINGKRCPECWKEENGLRSRKSHEVFLKEITQIWNNDYELLSKYETQNKKVKVLHKKCGRVFEAVPDSLLRNSGCPYCKESRGEKEITKYLINNGIKFKPQYKFDDCIYKDRLIFDFALLYEDKVIALLEYQGIQHYKPVEAFGGKETFKVQKIKDDIKKSYAESKEITLIEIKYNEDIKSILDYKISKLIPR